MPNRPQDPPEGSYLLHMAPGISRPTSPPPPRKTRPIDQTSGIIENLQRSIEESNKAFTRGIERELSLNRKIDALLSKLGRHECPNCGQKDQDSIVDCDPGETGDTTRYCNLCSFSWPDLHPIRKEKNKCHGCNGAGGEWFDTCNVCRGTGKSSATRQA